MQGEGESRATKNKSPSEGGGQEVERPRKLWLKPCGVTEGRSQVIDGPLSAVVSILKIRSMESAGCRSAPLLDAPAEGEAKGSRAL